MGDVMDDALDALADTGPEFGIGLSNHGPMGAESLVALGRVEAVLPWVEHYRQRRGLDGRPEAGGPVSAESWEHALGDFGRFAGWVELFEGELAEAEHPAVLRRWVPRLLAGAAGASGHGLIRTAHAVRSLDRARTPQRVHELAQGLGYWAARYQTLPGKPATSGNLTAAQAVRRLELLPASRRPPSGLISDVLKRLEDFPPFAEAIHLFGVSGDPPSVLSELAETFSGLYLIHAERAAIAFIHSVTVPSALRLLAPHLDEKTLRTGLQHVWQVSAAIYTAYGEPSDGQPLEGAVAVSESQADELVERALASGDEHAIKFTEACLREHAVSPEPVFVTAARDSADRLG
jgi:hypothetical protein